MRLHLPHTVLVVREMERKRGSVGEEIDREWCRVISTWRVRCKRRTKGESHDVLYNNITLTRNSSSGYKGRFQQFSDILLVQPHCTRSCFSHFFPVRCGDERRSEPKQLDLKGL